MAAILVLAAVVVTATDITLAEQRLGMQASVRAVKDILPSLLPHAKASCFMYNHPN